MTVEEICAEAGVGRSTFYLHFESKDQLLASLAEGTGGGVASDLDAVRGSASLDEQLDIFIRGVTRGMEGAPRSLGELVIHSQRVQAMKAPGRRQHPGLDQVRRHPPGSVDQCPPSGRAGPIGRHRGAG